MKERLSEVLSLEVSFLITVFWMFSYFFYLVFLRAVNVERHERLKQLFRESLVTFIGFAAFFGGHYFLVSQGIHPTLEAYVGVAALLMGALFFVRTCKIVVFEYLFLSSMREGVPVLLVNMVTLTISIFLASWILTSIFAVRIAPLLATSALLSVVLGLALQDTLGNLFAGIALQFDKPYEIGDWIEVHTEESKFIGKVEEITWRATLLYGLFDEVLTLPNRLISQAEVTNFSGRKKPVYHGFSIHVDPLADQQKVRTIFEAILKDTDGIIQTRPKYIMLRELDEKGALWRVVYPILNYGDQFSVVDLVLVRVQADFKKNNISLGRFRVEAQANFNPPRES